jgi:hypothetical protein
MLHNMSAVLRSNGLGAFYTGYFAFLLKGLPYDVAELFSYSQLSTAPGPLQRIPAECKDMLIGVRAPLILALSCAATQNAI